MSGVNGLDAVVGPMLEKMLAKQPEHVRQLVRENVAKQQERARSTSADPTTLAELSARIARSDARAATAMEEVKALRSDVTSLRALVMEMTVETKRNTDIMHRVASELGVKTL